MTTPTRKKVQNVYRDDARKMFGEDVRGIKEVLPALEMWHPVAGEDDCNTNPALSSFFWEDTKYQELCNSGVTVSWSCILQCSVDAEWQGAGRGGRWYTFSVPGWPGTCRVEARYKSGTRGTQGYLPGKESRVQAISSQVHKGTMWPVQEGTQGTNGI